jgi:ketosteroid isomerase-like protein
MSQENVHGYRIECAAADATRQHRTPDERVLVRFPALDRYVLYLWSWLPRTARLRRVLLGRWVGQTVSAANRRDFDVLVLALDPQIDYRAYSGPRGSVMPDLVGHHYGHAAYRNLWRVIMESFEDLTVEPQEVLDLGNNVIAVSRLVGHGSSSGIPLDNQFLFQVFTLRRGLVVKQEDFGSREEALQAVGLRE